MERKAVLRVVVWVALAAGPAAAQIDAFDWTLVGNPAGTGSATPTNLHVIGPDNSGCTPPVTYFETVLPVGGTLSVLVEFQNLDWYYYKGQAWYDAPAWVIDGAWDMPPETGVYPPGPAGWPTGPYEFQFEVEAGQHVGLGIWSLDCYEGPGVADFHDLVLLPKPWSTHAAALDPRDLWTTDVPSYQPVMATAGDVDLDGVADLVLGGSALTYDSDLRLLSGADGAVLLQVQTPAQVVRLVTGVGDVDGDGIPDVAVSDSKASVLGKAFSGFACITSGADGSTLLSLSGAAEWDELGTGLAGVGDVDLDGVPDLALGLPKVLSTKSAVELVSGATGAVLHVLVPTFKTNSFGATLASAGDVTGDGVPDVLVSGSVDGAVALVSGASGLIGKSFADTGALGFGQALAPAGDVDSDGVPDVLVGAPIFDGAVFVFSGATTALMSSFTGAAGARLGASVAGGFDVDGDGHLDVVAGAPDEQPGGAVHVHDALDSSPVAEFHAPHAQQHLGTAVAMPGDLDSDGLGDVAALAAPVNTPELPRVRTFSQLAHPGPPTLDHVGELAPHQLVTITVGHLTPGAAGFLVLGGALVDLPVAGGTLAPAPDVIIPIVAGAEGSADVSARWPAGLPTWSSLWMQAWIVDPAGPAGFSASDALAASQL